MIKSILIFILVIAAMVGVNAQTDSLVMVKALKAFDTFQEQREAYIPSDSLLLSRYRSEAGIYIHRQKIATKQTVDYVENGRQIKEVIYRPKDDVMSNATQKGYSEWLIAQKKRYLKQQK